VKPGDTITTRVEVLEVFPERNRIRLSTVCRNQHGEDVLTGEAWVMPARSPVVYDAAPPPRGARVPLVMQPWVAAAQAMVLWSDLGLRLLRLGLPRPAAPTSAGRR